MDKIVNLQDYKKSKPEDAYKELYDYLYVVVDSNISLIEEWFIPAKDKNEFNQIFAQAVNQILASVLNQCSKKEIIDFIRNGNLYDVQVAVSYVLSRNSVVQNVRNSIKK